MKTLAALALLLGLGAFPARAEDENGLAALRGELELLEIGRDVDRTLLREALIMVGHAEMSRSAIRQESDDARKRHDAELVALSEFTRAKAEAVLKRTAELEKKTAALAATTRKVNRPNPQPKPDDKDRQGLIDKMEEAQIEVELLQVQSQMYKQTLTQALNSLAAAEFAARNDEAQREKAEAERKKFNSVRAGFLDLEKALRLQQGKVIELRNRLGLGGGGGGFQ